MNPQDITQVSQGNPQQQVIERLKTAINVLVTVSNSPSVDQLAAAVGFTLTLNKMGKHATAVFSGDTPSTIEFLKPEATIEKNTDSLRDFIVSLDKSKADKLRYKVEDNVVKIFITPYRTSLTEKDLEFSQGDFNVDAVVALGVAEREQLDQAIIAHGRILHDATVITVSAGEKGSSLGAINWQDTSASSLSEMLVNVGEALQPGLLDNQIATAYLTGIVAQTERFRNGKTTPKIMTMSAQLMAAGANQQLIASSLDEAVEVPIRAETPEEASENPETPEKIAPADSPDGSLTIEHEEPAPKHDLSQESGLNLDMPDDQSKKTEEEHNPDQIDIDEHGNLSPAEEKMQPAGMRHRLVEPLQSQGPIEGVPSFAGGPHPLTGLGSDDGENEPMADPLSGKMEEAPQEMPPQILDHGSSGSPVSDDNSAQDPAPISAEPLVQMPTLPPLPDPAPVDPASTLPPVVAVDGPVSPKSDSVAPLADNIQTVPPFMDNNTLRDIEKTFDSTHIIEDPTSTLNEIEEVEHSPHLAQAEVVDSARDAVNSAINAAPYDANRPQPLQSLNAAPLSAPATTDPILAGLGLTDQPSASGLPIIGTAPAVPDPAPATTDATPPPAEPLFNDPSGQSPPPVPPPLMPLQ